MFRRCDRIFFLKFLVYVLLRFICIRLQWGGVLLCNATLIPHPFIVSATDQLALIKPRNRRNPNYAVLPTIYHLSKQSKLACSCDFRSLIPVQNKALRGLDETLFGHDLRGSTLALSCVHFVRHMICMQVGVSISLFDHPTMYKFW